MKTWQRLEWRLVCYGSLTRPADLSFTSRSRLINATHETKIPWWSGDDENSRCFLGNIINEHAIYINWFCQRANSFIIMSFEKTIRANDDSVLVLDLYFHGHRYHAARRATKFTWIFYFLLFGQFLHREFKKKQKSRWMNQKRNALKWF